MSKVSEEMKKREIVMKDGRYMIFYTFAPEDRPSPSGAAVPFPEGPTDEPAEEN